MIRTARVDGATHEGVVFPESAAIKRYITDDMRGVEFGAAAHNPFQLPGSINIAPVGEPGTSDYKQHEGYQRAQTQMCGAYAIVDVDGTVTDTGLPDDSQDYVVSSHVLEHCPNPLAAFLEWNRILKPNGIVACIVPKRDAMKQDGERAITPLRTIVQAYRDRVDADTPELEQRYPGLVCRRGHYTVWAPPLIHSLLSWANANLRLCWTLLEFHETDDKVSNGHLFITRYVPVASEPHPRAYLATIG